MGDSKTTICVSNGNPVVKRGPISLRHILQVFAKSCFLNSAWLMDDFPHYGPNMIPVYWNPTIIPYQSHYHPIIITIKSPWNHINKYNFSSNLTRSIWWNPTMLPLLSCIKASRPGSMWVKYTWICLWCKIGSNKNKTYIVISI
jgi:hypothetical protein